MITKLLGLTRGDGTEDIVNTRFDRYMQPIVNTTQDAGALDNSQCFLMDVVDTGTDWYLYYAGATTQTVNYAPDGQDYTNNDTTFLAIKTKSNDVRTGWVKELDVNSDPKPILKPSFVNGRFDKWQVWMRSVIKEGATWKGWFVGDDGTPTFAYRVGYATSSDGISWTKSGTTAIYEDAAMASSRGIAVLKVVNNGTDYVMIYSGIDPNVSGFFIATSPDGTTWTKTISNLFSNSEYGFPSDFKYSGGTYYLWLQRGNMMPAGNLGPCREVVLFSSTNLTDWASLGVQIRIANTAQEFGVGNHTKVLQKPNNEWCMVHTFYVNRTQALAGITKEPPQGIKVAESEVTDSFIMNSQCSFAYPSYVTFHAPLDYESGFTEVISGVSGTISGVAAYAERGFIRMNGSQVITIDNGGGIINGGDFAVKMRVQVLTAGTHELFRIGNDILVTLESGKLRVRLSSDGSAYQKDYITSVNISKPSGLDYIDDHIYIAFLWNGSTLRMWNDFVEFTAGEITKTVDNALATVNNSGSDVLIGQNASIELRSVSICDSITATELVELDI